MLLKELSGSGASFLHLLKVMRPGLNWVMLNSRKPFIFSHKASEDGAMSILADTQNGISYSTRNA